MGDCQAEMHFGNVNSRLPKNALSWNLWYTEVGR